ncbi:hypothetical protein Mp_3g08310 [Marchantia polymorpha subsp. ruderalis]|uniref:Uncharacterized protein n=2 Tax=Marchantia polymorpha TaxID=3197 RepID=A0AAF6AYM9_MARPO|nr:hypothetical protein MARPO_0006s0305 [Marchantia polymorpha]BBN04863.1 hypothetical protein Mp_3g08310 [Marchantia polymorpha subsp. ruderalis]|eukprot:PTQ48315.1 hypothetical protein MARPO_0006s0305 [Marchantia polymorpha]
MYERTQLEFYFHILYYSPLRDDLFYTRVNQRKAKVDRGEGRPRARWSRFESVDRRTTTTTNGERKIERFSSCFPICEEKNKRRKGRGREEKEGTKEGRKEGRKEGKGREGKGREGGGEGKERKKESTAKKEIGRSIERAGERESSQSGRGSHMSLRRRGPPSFRRRPGARSARPQHALHRVPGARTGDLQFAP